MEFKLAFILQSFIIQVMICFVQNMDEKHKKLLEDCKVMLRSTLLPEKMGIPVFRIASEFLHTVDTVFEFAIQR